MQGSTTPLPPVGVVFDSGMGSRIGEVLALAVLYGLEGRSEARVVSLSVSRSNLKAAALCEIMARFYVAGATPGIALRVPPIGLSTRRRLIDDTPILTEPLSRKNADGSPVYPHGIHSPTDTAEVYALIRNAFTAQHDQNCVVVLAGPATNLAGVLDVPGAKELIARKVRLLAVAAGAYPEGGPEFNMATDIAAAQKVFEEWPSPIVACGSEIGKSLRFPASSLERDFSWASNHPVVDAYKAFRPMPYEAETSELAAVLYAVRGAESPFATSGPGIVEILENGGTRFVPSPQGRHAHLILDPSRQEEILGIFTELASARPVPRQRRQAPPQE